MDKYVWLICYIDITQLHCAEKDLAKKYRRYSNIELFVPTVKVLEKTHKKADKYKDIPLLLNYGFVKVPEHFIYNEELLRILQRDIKAIYVWLKDPAKVVKRKKAKKKLPIVAIASDREITQLMELCKKYQINSAEHIAELEVGKCVTLKTYPFQDTQVEIVSINHKRKEVEVKLVSDVSLQSTIKVSFDHLFYTVYHDIMNFNPLASKEQSLDELMDNGYSINKLGYYESFE